MYQTKHIHYKAIFKQDGQQETMEYKVNGIVDLQSKDKTWIHFQSQEGIVQIIYDQQEVTLQHGESVLLLKKHEDVHNVYQLPYGQVHLTTRLLKLEANEQRMQMKYELYDQQGLLSTVYVMVTFLPYHMMEEL